MSLPADMHLSDLNYCIIIIQFRPFAHKKTRSGFAMSGKKLNNYHVPDEKRYIEWDNDVKYDEEDVRPTAAIYKSGKVSSPGGALYHSPWPVRVESSLAVPSPRAVAAILQFLWSFFF